MTILDNVKFSGMMDNTKREGEKMTEDISADKLVAVYIKMRDKRAELLRGYEEEDGAV